MSYIEREAILKYSRAMLDRAAHHIRTGQTESDTWKAIHHTQQEERAEFVSLLENAPAADVAEVVRCKDCIYSIEGRCFSRTSFLNAPAVKPDNFCSWGATE